MLLLAVVLYKYIPARKVIPITETYVASNDIVDLLEDDIDTRKENHEVILTYEVTSGDLSNYQKTYDYIPGKSNPFAVYAKTIETDENGTPKEQTTDNTETQSKETKSENEPTTKKIEETDAKTYENSQAK